MFSFLIITLLFGVIVWFAQTKIPTFGWMVAAVFILIWIFKYLLPFLGVSI